MSRAAALRLGAFAGALALAFGAAYGIGSAVDPIAAADDTSAAPAHGEEMGGMEQGADHGAESSGQLPGLAVSDAGYTFAPTATQYQAGSKYQLRFTIKGPDGKPVTKYIENHEKDLHLIVVRRDLSGFQHVHPTMDASGMWSVPLTFPTGGTWRLYADFKPDGLDRNLTLGTDVSVSGSYVPVALPQPASVDSFQGYDVTLAGTPVAGKESELTFRINKGGKPVTDLQPYLGAFGHLVSLRTGDLAYLHTHPGEEATASMKGGPEIKFATTFPTAGTYRLFLDFQHQGAVRTAEFTVKVSSNGTAVVPPAELPSPGHVDSPGGH